MSNYSPNAYEYGTETIATANGLTSQAGFSSRTTTTTWVRQSGDAWLLKLFSARTVSDSGAPAPASLTSNFDMTTLRGFLSSTSVSSGNRTLTTTYTPDPVSRDPISRTVTLTDTGVPTSQFVDTRTFQSGLSLTSQRTGIGWQSFHVGRDASTGLITSSSDPNGLQAGYSYDLLRRLLGITPPGVAATTLTYASNTDVTEATFGDDGTLPWSRYRYDGFGRMTREIRRLPGSAYAVRTHVFNEAGLTKKDSEWVSCASVASGGDCLTADPAGTTYSNFDPLGRARQVVRADGSSTTIDFTDGAIFNSDTLQATTTNVNTGAVSGYPTVPSVTQTRKDIFGRIISVTEPGGDVTNYRYNVLGKLAEVTQSDGTTTQTRSFVYDALGFLESEVHPEKGTTQYLHSDALGNVLQKIDGTVTSNYTYDAAGRLTALLTGPSPGTTAYARTCYVENLGTTDCPTSTSVTNANAKILRTVGYNPAASQAPTVMEDFDYAGAGGRMSSKTTTITSGGTNLLQAGENWYYNSLGLVRGHVRPRPAVGNTRPFAVATEYDQGLPVREVLNGLQLVKSVTYHPSGAIASYTTGVDLGAQVTTTTTFDGVMPRPARISATLQPGGSTQFDTGSYQYDATGNICTIGGDTFGYDPRSRLAYAAYPGLAAPNTESFQYDQFGNMTSRAGANAQTYAIDTTTNHLSTYGYLRGSLVGPGTSTSYTWDDLDRMSGQATGSWAYAYTAENERIGKLPQGQGWTFSLRDPQKRLETEFAGTVPSKDNVFLGNLLVASFTNPDVSGNAWSWAFYSSDHLGTPRFSTSLDGTLVESHKYWPFGEETTAPLSYQRLRFAAMENDPEGTRAYDHARHHDFGLARFLAPDALSGRPEDAQGWNRYAYARNNPLAFVDPNGLDAIPVVFPQYRVATPVGKMQLGHAGIIMINNKTGATRYYEYGRYDPEAKGLVRRMSVPNVTMGSDGYPTQSSLKHLFDVVRKQSGQGGPLEGVYIKDDHYDDMVKYAEGRRAENDNPDRESYGLFTNNCMSFAEECVQSVGGSTPTMINPIPSSYMKKWEGSVGSDSANNDGAARAVKVCNNDGCHFEIR